VGGRQKRAGNSTSLAAYPTQKNTDRPPAPHANCLYALVVHTLGNAEENLLWTLFDQPSQRNREQEFLMEGPSKDALILRWNGLHEQLQQALLSLSLQDLAQEHLHPRRGSITGLDILIVVARHAAEHLGQAELTRDLVLALLMLTGK
jgi:hypothetical protein